MRRWHFEGWWPCLTQRSHQSLFEEKTQHLQIAGWAHVVCALYIPEVQFANVSTMEPIVLQSVPHDRYNKV
ncbi:Protein AF-10 [Varanus komodoensis]|nr:Protein AF-10 [Varanus komodoensis]